MKDLIDRWCPGTTDGDRTELVANLTLILLLLHTPGFWYVQSPVAVLSICGLIYRPVRRSPKFWLIVTAFLAVGLILNWFSMDNHKYLEAYWTLALCGVCSLPESEREQTLARNGRWLLALCMSFAVFWKLNSASYLSSSFFEFTLLTDGRFEHFASWFGQVPRHELIHNRETVQAMVMGYVDGINLDKEALQTSRSIRMLAQCMTWWTLAIEGSLAVLFWLPAKARLAVARDTLLLLFAVTTYLVANVQGFGWLLMILGISQCRRKGLTLLYFATFLLIEVYNIPSGEVVTSIWGSGKGP